MQSGLLRRARGVIDGNAAKLRASLTLFMVVPSLAFGLAGSTPISTGVAQTATPTNLVATLNSPEPLAIKDAEVNIKIEKSRANTKSTSKTARRTRVSQPVQTVTVTDADFATKRATVQQAAAAYNIDWRILEAVWQVETGKRWYTTVHSYSGAQGPLQFMLGTWRTYGVDGNGDGVKNVYFAPDALFGAAHLLSNAGLSSGAVDRALLSYNHSYSYVSKVKQIAYSIQ